MNWKNFYQKMFCEPTGQPSFGRGSFGFVLLAAMALLAYQIIAGKAYSLAEWAMFLVSVGGITYGVNKVASAFGTNKVEAAPAEPPKTS